MASGHANRANRPNTWLHRPATQRDVLTCQPGAVHTWLKADMNQSSSNVRLRLKSYVSKTVRNGGFQVARWWDSGARKHNDHMGAFAVPFLLKSLN